MDKTTFISVDIEADGPVPGETTEFSFKLHGLEPLEVLPRIVRAVRR